MSELSRRAHAVKKYRLDAIVDIAAEDNGQRLGRGPLMAEETLQKFIDGDPSGNLKYLDWMLFMAGGGEARMRRSIDLWNGSGPADTAALRSQCRADFVQSRMDGEDDDGNPIRKHTKAEAERAWGEREASAMHEFVMGDQDIAKEEGYGFYRHWPGPGNLYAKIVDAVQLWHRMQGKLAAQNKKLESLPKGLNRPEAVLLDLYAGWKPSAYSQLEAKYSNLQDLSRVLASVRKFQVLRDIQFDLVYEDELVRVLCPLTVGASVAYGLNKWCVSNMSEFDRAFSGGSEAHINWQTYCAKGPLLFFNWKCPMPVFMHKLAVHLDAPCHRAAYLAVAVPWFDCENKQGGTSFAELAQRINTEAVSAGQAPIRIKRLPAADGDAIPALAIAESTQYEKWGGRSPGLAWASPEEGKRVLASLKQANTAIRKWALGFDTNRIKLNFGVGSSALEHHGDYTDDPTE